MVELLNMVDELVEEEISEFARNHGGLPDYLLQLYDNEEYSRLFRIICCVTEAEDIATFHYRGEDLDILIHMIIEDDYVVE